MFTTEDEIHTDGRGEFPNLDSVPTDIIKPPPLRDRHKRVTRRTAVDRPDDQ